ncbi:DUF6672 family protein [Marinitoga sp. 38H-ov]|uniref:DUF6672 family protein n=1 Tax=Marinitoga sp. 38H-ov TaxID=1755814 RepID=UPI0013EB4797|nr:DUF6672 family protein [Marinitoga sp. 38H-ov]KAF2955081.1 hypothetical protein AS160_02275 [Marinitoga sp. 38H-ov]
MNKRLIIRLMFIIALFLLGVLLFNIGQQHKVFVDNKTFKNYNYINETLEVKVDDVILKVRKKSRKVAKVVGPKHKITFEYNGKIIEKEFKIPINQDVIINIPALINGDNEYIEYKSMRE